MSNLKFATCSRNLWCLRSLFCILLLIASSEISAQNTIAIIKYEEAEKAYYEEDYKLVLERLQETEEILGQTAPKILHLRILAQHKLYEFNPFESYEKLEALKTNVTYYLNNFDIAGLEEKYRDIYDVQIELEDSPNSVAAFYEAEKKAEAEKQRIKREKEAYIASLSPMVLVEGGSFKMGGSDKNPTYTLTDYYIGKYEVTQKLWKYVIGTLPEGNKDCENCPVNFVTWNDAVDFISRFNELTDKNYRLPTEAEWEFAAIGGNKSMGYKYSGSNTAELVGHFGSYKQQKTNKYDDVYEVGLLKPNELGIYDMSGNVSEWCSDWFTNNLRKLNQSMNPTGPSSESLNKYKVKIVRGGSVYTVSKYGKEIGRRMGFAPEFNQYHATWGGARGFRLAHTTPME